MAPTQRPDAPADLVLIVDHQLPTPDQDSGSLRLTLLIEQLRAMGRQVLFFPLNGEAPEPYRTRLTDRGVAVVRSPAGQERFLRDMGHRIALALLCRPQPAIHMLGKVRDRAPDCVVAYDTVDVHFRRFGRQAELAEREGRTDRYTLRAEAETSQALELLLMRECDVTLVVSEEERTLLHSFLPEADIRVLSNVHDPQGAPPAGDRPPSAEARVLFVGNYLHAPNVDAARWLAEEIMPSVRAEVPHAVLDLVGTDPAGALASLDGEGVTVRGWVPDLAPVYRRSRVAVAPLRFGAGVKGKVGEALERGIPVAGTRIAFEGMGLEPERHVLEGETAEELAAHIVRLLRDDRLAARLVEAAGPVVASRFGPAAARAALQDLLAVRPRASRKAVHASTPAAPVPPVSVTTDPQE